MLTRLFTSSFRSVSYAGSCTVIFLSINNQRQIEAMENAMEPLKLKINLENMPTAVYRRVLVPADINMMQLHFIIQISMGWRFAHLFSFMDKKGRTIQIEVGIPYEDETFDLMDWPEMLKADEVSIQTFYDGLDKKPFWYWYDFRDDWWHKISFQKPTKADLKIYAGSPVCIEGVGACPPEDIGGPWGYSDFLEIIEDNKHPYYQEMRYWADLEKNESFDINYFDQETTNVELLNFSNSGQWHLKADDYYQ